jgi:uncharacterized protein involved in exopolysaccharide biosynthesis
MFSPIDLIALLRQHRSRILAAGVIGAIAIAASGLIGSRQWEARSTFTSFQTGAALPGGLSALTQQLGVQLPQGGDGGTPLFYSVLIRSRGLLRALIAQPKSLPASPRELADVLDVKPGLAGDLRREATVDKLLKAMSVDLNRESGIVTVTVRTSDPKVSLWINASLLQLMDAYFGAIRRTRAGSERRFADEQRTLARREVRTAEEELEAFLRNNKNYSGSPTLTTEFERLSREVSLRQSVYSSLEQAFYKARLDEVRDTPTISVIEQPVQPPKPVSRFLALRALFGMLLGAILMTLALVGRMLLAPAMSAGSGVVPLRTLDASRPADVSLTKGSAAKP